MDSRVSARWFVMGLSLLIVLGGLGVAQADTDDPAPDPTEKARLRMVEHVT